MGDQQMFAGWLEENTDNFLAMYDENDHSDEPEALVEIGKLNPSLYYLIVQDEKDIQVFERISDIKFASNLILFTASAFIVFDTVKTTKSIAKDLSKVAVISTKVTTKVATTGEGIVEIAPTALNIKKSPKAVSGIYSNLQLLAQTALKLPRAEKNRIMDTIGIRILDLDDKIRNLKKENILWWHDLERDKTVRRFWNKYYKTFL